MKVENLYHSIAATPRVTSSTDQILEEAIAVLPLLLLTQNLTSVLSYVSSDSLPFTPSPSDVFHFGKFWSDIRPCKEDGNLYREISARREEIREITEYWRERLLFDPHISPPAHWEPEIKHLLTIGSLSLAEEGIGGAYLLKDGEDHPFFVIKPMDEDILCLNNKKHRGNPLNTIDLRPREAIPLYRSSPTDALASRFAELMQLPHVTPQAAMGIIEDARFHDILDSASDQEKGRLVELSGTAQKEKLCSIQPYAPHDKMLFALVHDLLQEEIEEDAIEDYLDQENFEEVNIFVWTTYDNDAHSGNFLVYRKDTNEPVRYGLIKIDNSLSFPEKNIDLLNNLAYFPNAEKALSQKGKQRIADLPIEEMIHEMLVYKMDQAIAAFQERIEVLQILAQRENITLSEINTRLMALELEDGREIALGPLPIKEIEKQLFGSSTTPEDSSS